jgi:hypothetical protein
MSASIVSIVLSVETKLFPEFARSGKFLWLVFGWAFAVPCMCGLDLEVVVMMAAVDWRNTWPRKFATGVAPRICYTVKMVGEEVCELRTGLERKSLSPAFCIQLLVR